MKKESDYYNALYIFPLFMEGIFLFKFNKKKCASVINCSNIIMLYFLS